MKKVVNGEELYQKMQEAVSLLCGTVKKTLGPQGNNIIIDHSNFSPFITNDGVTIAENIESDDAVVNTILELAKEASLNTNDKVGDGTTTTLVLLESIFNQGLKIINKKVSAIVLKKELNEAMLDIITRINQLSKVPERDELVAIAKVSSNDEEIGQIVSDVYLNILNKEGITIKEGEEENTRVNYLKGYSMDSNLASPYFLAGLKEQRLANVQILIGDFILTDIEEIASLINILIKNKKSLVIIANDYSAEFIQSILEINTNYDLKVFLLKTPEYGFRQQSILADLGAIANCEIVHAPNAIQYNNLGQIDNMVISNEKCNMDFKYNDKIKRHILRLNENIKNTNTEQDFIAKRITMLESGTAEILVGGITTTERREKRMRFEDALCSVNLAAKGVVPGGGITLAKIADQLSASNDGFHILKEALKEPLKQILINAGLNDIDINTKIKNNNFNRLFNINTNQYEEIEKTRVLDATDVVLNSLKNAVSIASILLTTSSVVINEYKANSNSQNIYEEL